MPIEDTAHKIKTMEIRGAGKIGRAAAEALSDFALQSQKTDTKEFIADLTNAKDTLLNTRPTAVSLANALSAVMVGAKGSTVDEIRAGVANAAKQFISESVAAVEIISDICADEIEDGNTIMTHCNSTVVVKSIIKAYKQNKNIDVFATETRPWHQGHITSKALAGAGVDVTLIVDSAARTFLADTDLVLFGADTITRNGTVFNKIGTSQIAVCAHEQHVPVYVCAETYKFSRTASNSNQVAIEERDTSEIIEPGKLKDVKVRNPVFDATPIEYINAIITEQGIVSFKELKSFIKTLK